MTALALASLMTASIPPPFSPGEELVFQVRALGLRSGTVTFNVGAAEEVEHVSVWPIVMIARTQGMTDAVYSVRDKFVSFWDPAARLPVEATLSANEGGKTRSLAIRFHRAAGDAKAQVQTADAHETKTVAEPMDPAAQDLQSAVYWLRGRPLHVGDREEVPIVAGKRQWTLQAEVVRALPLDVPAGHFDAVQVRLRTFFSGKLKAQSDIDGYFSQDARHLPLRFDAALVLGRVTAELSRFSGADLE